MEQEEKVKYRYANFKVCINNVNTGPPLNTTLSNLQIDLKAFCDKFEDLVKTIDIEIKVMVFVRVQVVKYAGKEGAPFDIKICKPPAVAVLKRVSKRRLFEKKRSGGTKKVEKYVVTWKDFCLVSLFLYGKITPQTVNTLFGCLASAKLRLVYE